MLEFSYALLILGPSCSFANFKYDLKFYKFYILATVLLFF